MQDFYPTPGTLSTTMFYTGLDPLNYARQYMYLKLRKKKLCKELFLQFSNPKNYNIVYDALMKAGREDLIGNGPKCLIRSKEQRYMDAHGLGYKGKSQGKSKDKGEEKAKTLKF